MFTSTYATSSPNPRPLSPLGVAWLRLLAARSREDLDRVATDCDDPDIARTAQLIKDFNADEDLVREVCAREEPEIDEWIRENIPDEPEPDCEAVRQLLRDRPAVIKITIRPRDPSPEGRR